MAEGLGVKLGDIPLVEESSAITPVIFNDRMIKAEASMDMSSVATATQPGELEINATATVVFNIK